MSGFIDAVDGFDPRDSVARSWSDNAQRSPAPAAVSNISGIVTSQLKQRHPLTGRDLPFLREHAPGRSRSPFPGLGSSRQFLSSTDMPCTIPAARLMSVLTPQQFRATTPRGPLRIEVVAITRRIDLQIRDAASRQGAYFFHHGSP
jgi:hypothetical protein